MELFTEEEYNQSKSRELLNAQCDCCKKPISRTKRYFQRNRREGRNHYCSGKCVVEATLEQRHRKPSQLIKCTNCNKTVKKKNRDIQKSKNHFCSQSCSSTWNNTHRTSGTRRSKLETWLEKQLLKLYSNFEFKFNSKEEINSELDIYIPSLKLAFELNGIFHYEPIYGEDKLNQIQNNDNRKFKACAENGISLCIIDTSSQKYFKESTSKKFLKIITSIIEKEASSTPAMF